MLVDWVKIRPLKQSHGAARNNTDPVPTATLKWRMKVDFLDTGFLLGTGPHFQGSATSFIFKTVRYWKSFSALIDYSIFGTKHAVHDHKPGIPGGGGSSQINVKWILVVSLSVRKCGCRSHLRITRWKSNISTGINASLGIGLCGEKFLYEKQTPSCCERVQSPLGTNKSEPLLHAILDSF